jgi:predicted dehydrogenase
MDKVRYGIIGLGNQGSFYLRLFLEGKIDDGEVTAVCDINPDKIKNAQAKGFNGATFADYKDMIASGLVDAILVEVPHYFHPEISIYGLTHGMHVLCDKPAGVYTKQVKEMNAVADKSNKLFGLMFNQRTDCNYRAVREMIKNGELGEIKRVNWIITNWFRTQAYYNSSSWRATWKGEGGGVLLNQCPHQLDLIQWVTGMMPSSIHSFCRMGKWHDIEVEDDVTAYLEYPNGATGVFITTTGEGCGTNRLEIVGEKGKIVVENDKVIHSKSFASDSDIIKTDSRAFVNPIETEYQVQTDGSNLQHLGILLNFTKAILGKEDLFVKGQEGINGVQIMDAMLLSSFLGKAVTLPIDDDLYLEELNKRIANSADKQVEEVVFDTSNSFAGAKK